MDARDMGADLDRILVTAEDIDARLSEMASQIDDVYRGGGRGGGDLLLVGVLRGAVMVMADLARKIAIPVEMDWMAVSPTVRGPSPPASCGSSRTSTPTSPDATS